VRAFTISRKPEATAGDCIRTARIGHCFLQLLWQVGGMAFLLFVGSPQSKEGDDRMEAKLDAILAAVDPKNADRIVDEIDREYAGRPHRSALDAAGEAGRGRLGRRLLKLGDGSSCGDRVKARVGPRRP
jgi:hypothetical protein